MLLKRKLGTKNIKLEIDQLTHGNKGYFLIFMDSSFICGASIMSTLIILIIIIIDNIMYMPDIIAGIYIDHLM